MPAFDHRAPMSVTETLPAKAISQHGLDLRQIGGPNNIMIFKHAASFARVIAIVTPALTRSGLGKLFNNVNVFWPRHREYAVLCLRSSTPTLDWSRLLRIQSRQEGHQLIDFPWCGQSCFHDA